MRAIGRFIFNTLACISFLLLLVMAQFWGRTYSQIGAEAITSGWMEEWDSWPPGKQPTWEEDLMSGHAGPEFDDHLYGFGIWLRREPKTNQIVEGVVQIPFWFCIPILAILPTIWFVKRRRIKRKLLLIAQGRCGSCGYDLTANETSECPECGKQFDLKNWTVTVGPEHLKARLIFRSVLAGSVALIVAIDVAIRFWPPIANYIPLITIIVCCVLATGYTWSRSKITQNQKP